MRLVQLQFLVQVGRRVLQGLKGTICALSGSDATRHPRHLDCAASCKLSVYVVRQASRNRAANARAGPRATVANGAQLLRRLCSPISVRLARREFLPPVGGQGAAGGRVLE